MDVHSKSLEYSIGKGCLQGTLNPCLGGVGSLFTHHPKGVMMKALSLLLLLTFAFSLNAQEWYKDKHLLGGAVVGVEFYHLASLRYHPETAKRYALLGLGLTAIAWEGQNYLRGREKDFDFEDTFKIVIGGAISIAITDLLETLIERGLKCQKE